VAGLLKPTTTTAAEQAATAAAAFSPAAQPRARSASEGGGAAKLTVGGHFRSQMADLAALLQTTNKHFVRCVKPNQVPTY
jgi:myosin heavy subunit